jgi:hypothetical protein
MNTKKYKKSSAILWARLSRPEPGLILVPLVPRAMEKMETMFPGKGVLNHSKGL